MTQTKKQREEAEWNALMDEEPCPHPAKMRTGIVTNQPDGYDADQPHASMIVCGNPSCRAAALGWVYRATGQHGTYVPDGMRRSA